ncbi:hypothetical protein B0H17DRAFT_1182251 [Mycena rosella]|uniref:Uncharacterized protein n=1 Tax=Mycena rosella TaxID=1033263 RepID=A0AAD7D4Y3_MYCRO|nr:hypothetical protein B0H17DRAFT_1182251 [Mycena rosella]
MRQPGPTKLCTPPILSLQTVRGEFHWNGHHWWRELWRTKKVCPLPRQVLRRMLDALRREYLGHFGFLAHKDHCPGYRYLWNPKNTMNTHLVGMNDVTEERPVIYRVHLPLILGSPRSGVKPNIPHLPSAEQTAPACGDGTLRGPSRESGTRSLSPAWHEQTRGAESSRGDDPAVRKSINSSSGLTITAHRVVTMSYACLRRYLENDLSALSWRSYPCRFRKLFEEKHQDERVIGQDWTAWWLGASRQMQPDWRVERGPRMRAYKVWWRRIWVGSDHAGIHRDAVKLSTELEDCSRGFGPVKPGQAWNVRPKKKVWISHDPVVPVDSAIAAYLACCKIVG